MRAWIFSDLHIDDNIDAPFLLPRPHPDHDVVIEQGLNQRPVVYVPGNHEYYGYDFETERSAGTAGAAHYENVHVLDRSTLMVDGVLFVGATLWTDYQLFTQPHARAAMQRAEATMNDHRLIRHKGRSWRAVDAAYEHGVMSRPHWMGDRASY